MMLIFAWFLTGSMIAMLIIQIVALIKKEFTIAVVMLLPIMVINAVVQIIAGVCGL